MNISVIIPVYKVEQFVERCIRSVMDQTLTEGVECIIVDDCTPDRSMKIVEEMVAGYHGNIQFKLLYHEWNRGLAAVRNTGLNVAVGDYILHVDSDDYFEPDTLEKMYGKAIAEDADIVVADYWMTYKDREVCYTQHVPDSQLEALKYLVGMKLRGFNWNKLFRRSLYNDNELRYTEGVDMGEDLLMSLQMFFYARKIVGIPQAFLHYVQYNGNAYSQCPSLKSMKCLIYIESFMIDFFSGKGLLKSLQKEILSRQLFYQKGLLLGTKGKLQRKMNARYRHITPLVVLKYGSVLSWYWRVALFFVSLRMLPVFNMMRGFWGWMRPELRKRMTLYEEDEL